MQWPWRRKRRVRWASSPDSYTSPGWLGPIVVLVLCLVAVALIWLAYGWALNQWTPPA